MVCISNHLLSFEKKYSISKFSLSSLVTVVPTKSDSDVIFCLKLLSKTLTCTLHLS